MHNCRRCSDRGRLIAHMPDRLRGFASVPRQAPPRGDFTRSRISLKKYEPEARTINNSEGVVSFLLSRWLSRKNLRSFDHCSRRKGIGQSQCFPGAGSVCRGFGNFFFPDVLTNFAGSPAYLSLRPPPLAVLPRSASAVACGPPAIFSDALAEKLRRTPGWA